MDGGHHCCLCDRGGIHPQKGEDVYKRQTLRYAVELYRAPRPAIGELRVSARTQSQGLLESLTGFYQLWIQLETHYIGSRFPGGRIPCQVQELSLIHI